MPAGIYSEMEFNDSWWGPKWKIGFTTFFGFINADVVYGDDMAIIDWKELRLGK